MTATIDPAFDHVVLATPDLAVTVAEFLARTGVLPAPGGSHVGRGTANHLVAFRDIPSGGSGYLEIVGPDPSQPDPSEPRPFGIDELTQARVVTWAVHPQDLDATVAAARGRGFDPGDPGAMSRRNTEGELLEWRLTPADLRCGGLVPFLIDWGDTPHPTTRGDLPQIGLVRLVGTHPDPATVRRPLQALGVDLALDEAPTLSLTLSLDTPDGEVVF